MAIVNHWATHWDMPDKHLVQLLIDNTSAYCHFQWGENQYGIAQYGIAQNHLIWVSDNQLLGKQLPSFYWQLLRNRTFLLLCSTPQCSVVYLLHPMEIHNFRLPLVQTQSKNFPFLNISRLFQTFPSCVWLWQCSCVKAQCNCSYENISQNTATYIWLLCQRRNCRHWVLEKSCFQQKSGTSP